MKKPTRRIDVKGLVKIGQDLAKLTDNGPYKVRVGIFGDKNMREEKGPTNAEIGFIQEMGSRERNIPRRSFLYDTFTIYRRKVDEQIKPLVAKFFKKGKVDEYLKFVGIACTNVVQEAFHTSGFGAWKPNAPMTIAMKGSDKPLIDKGELWQAISFKVAR